MFNKVKCKIAVIGAVKNALLSSEKVLNKTRGIPKMQLFF